MLYVFGFVTSSRDILRYFMVGYFVNTFIVEASCKYVYKVYICNFTGSFIAQT